MFLSLYDEVTNVLCVSLLSHDRYQYDSPILSRTERILVNATAVVMRCFSSFKLTGSGGMKTVSLLYHPQ